MDWQQTTSLLIVAATAFLFAWQRLRRRKFSFARDTHCGCQAPGQHTPGQSIVYRARKGQRSEIIIKGP